MSVSSDTSCAGYGYPIAPLVVGMILGPMGEAQLRRALQLSQGNLTTLVTHPFAAIAYILLGLLIVGGLWLRRRRAKYELSLTAAIAEVEVKDRVL